MELRMVDTGEVRLACRVSGHPASPPLVLLHALGENGSDWDTVAEEFAGDHRVYVPDLRGHGRSDRPGRYSFELMRDDLRGLLDALRLERTTLVGHSMGGVVAYLFAQEHLERLERLVLEEAPPPSPRNREVPAEPAEPQDFDWDVVPVLYEQFTSPDPRWDARLPDITAPTLVIAGGSRSHVPQDQIADMARRIPDSRLVTIPAGHLVHAARPLEFAATLHGFLRPGRR